MLTYYLSLTMYRAELGYNGPLGTCPRCQQPGKQLRGGLCVACRQEQERRDAEQRREKRQKREGR